ncbi:MAG: hypothetical protein JOZ04_03015 [Acidimicrobiia bacterium]|nr:hypothetical protein [Acidimicrobiia bacterium]
MAHVDYEDCHLVDVPKASDRTAEAWARAVLEDAPESLRRSLRSGWRSLGIRLGPVTGAGVLGWPVRRSDPDVVLLGATSRLGMQGELLIERRPQHLLFATLLQFDNPLARAVWVPIARPHVRVVRYVLEQARARWE